LISKNVADFMCHRCAEDRLARKRYIQFRYWCNTDAARTSAYR